MTSIPRGMIGRGNSNDGHSIIRPVVVAACLAAALASPALAQQVILKVNGEVITNYDIEQRAKFNMLANRAGSPRKQIIEDLIDDKLKAQNARRYNIGLTDKDVDQQYADIAKGMHLNADQLTQVLNRGGVNVTTLKAKILADMSWQYYIRGRFQSRFQIGENELESGDVGYDYTLRPILLVVPTGNAPLMEARRKDADALRARFTNCESGLPAARAQHDVIIRPPITRNSSDFLPALRELLNKTALGHLTPPETTAQGVELFALCDKKETKSETPEKRDNKGKLINKKFEALSKAQLRDLRRQAMIEFIQ